MKIVSQRLLALIVALAFVAAGGHAAVLAQDDAERGEPAGQPPVGSAVPFISEEGTEVGTITITDFVDPFEDYDSSSPPERGYRFVEVGLEVANSGRRPFEFNSYSIYLQDTEGFLYTQTYVYRPSDLIEDRPDYPNESVAGGESSTGYIYFSVFSDAEIVRVVYTDGYSRLIFLADLTVEPLVPIGGDGEDEGTAEADTDTDTETDEDTDEDTDGLALSDEECEDVVAWYEESEARLGELEESFEVLGAENPDPDAIRDLADQIQSAAEEQADADVPDAAQEANDTVVALLEEFAGALNDFADAIEGGADPNEAALTLFGAIESLGSEADELVNELAAACDIEV